MYSLIVQKIQSDPIKEREIVRRHEGVREVDDINPKQGSEVITLLFIHAET